MARPSRINPKVFWRRLALTELASCMLQAFFEDVVRCSSNWLGLVWTWACWTAEHVPFYVSFVVSFCEGWRPVVHGTPTLTEWPMPFFVFPDSGVVPFCVGWRPVAYGTPTLTEWPAPSFVLFFLFLSQFMFNISAVREIQNEVS